MADPAAIMADPAAEGSSEATERRRKRRWDSDGDGTGGGDAAAVPAAAPISDPLALTLAGAAGMQLALLPDAASAAQAAAIAAAAARAQASITVKLHINDALPSQRAILMRPKMQQDIASKSGATITMVGVPYEKAELPAVKKTDPPPVYLEVGANDQSQVDRAVAMIGEILSDTPLPDPRSLSEQKLDMQNFHRKKLFIGLDDANPGFSVIGKVLGPNGQYLRHITDKSMARVDLKGRGSRAWDGSDEGMHLEISSRVEKHVTDAEKLCTDLIAAVQQMYKKWNQGREPYRPPVAMNPIPPPMGGAGMPPPPNPSGLPPGWEEKKTKEGRVFYINHNDKTTSWKKPEMPKPPGPPAFPSPPVAPPAAAPPALPGGQAPPGAGSDAPACDGKEGEGHALPASGGADGPNQAGGAAQQGAGGAGGAGGQVQAPPPMGAGQPPGAGAQWGAPPQPGWGGGGGGGGGYGGYGGGGYGGFGGGWGAPQPPNLPPPPLPPAHAPPPPPGQSETAPQDAAGAAES